MNRRLRQKSEQVIDIAELYAMKIPMLWKAFKMEGISLWMLCLYYFFEYVRPQNVYPALDILPWGQLSLMAALITAFMDPSARIMSNVQNRLLILFALILIISGFFAFRPSASLDFWPIMTGWVILYFLTTSVVNSEQKLLLFLIAYILFNLKMSLGGSLQFAMRGFSFRTYGLVGSPGYFKNSGEFAIQMLMFGSLSVALAFSLKDYWGKYKKVVLYVFAISGYLVVLGASSRGSQLGLLVIGVWFLLKQKNGFKGLILLTLAAAILFYFLPETQMQRFREMGDDSNSVQRLTYWMFAIEEVFPKNPIIGVGYHNWLSYVNYLAPEGMGPLQTVQEPHNIFIQALAELGLVGFVLFLLLIIYCFKNNAHTRVMAKKLNKPLLFNLSYGLDAGLIGFLVAGSFVSVLYYPFFWVQMTMIVMLNNVTRQQYDKLYPEVNKKRSRRSSRALNYPQ